jgi:hypothetical protein
MCLPLLIDFGSVLYEAKRLSYWPLAAVALDSACTTCKLAITYVSILGSAFSSCKSFREPPAWRRICSVVAFGIEYFFVDVLSNADTSSTAYPKASDTL